MADEQMPAPEPGRDEQAERGRRAAGVGSLLGVAYVLIAGPLHYMIAALLGWSDDSHPGLWAIRLLIVVAAIIPALMVAKGSGVTGFAYFRRIVILFLVFAGLAYLPGGALVDFR